MKFMFDKMEDWAEIMGITKSHPQWEAYNVVWNMARAQASWLEDKKEEDDETSDVS